MLMSSSHHKGSQLQTAQIPIHQNDKYGHSVESHSGEDVLTTEQLMDIKEPVVLFYTILSIVCV